MGHDLVLRFLNLDQLAKLVGLARFPLTDNFRVSEWVVRRMIEEKTLPARQVIVCAPWQIPVEALDSEVIRQQAMNIKNRVRVPQNHHDDDQEALFSER